MDEIEANKLLNESRVKLDEIDKQLIDLIIKRILEQEKIHIL